MLMCLLDEIGELPPQDFLANAQMRATQIKLDREKKSALSTFNVTKGKVRRRPDGD